MVSVSWFGLICWLVVLKVWILSVGTKDMAPIFEADTSDAQAATAAVLAARRAINNLVRVKTGFVKITAFFSLVGSLATMCWQKLRYLCICYGL